MFGISLYEFFVILIIALLILPPKEIISSLATIIKFINNLKDYLFKFKENITKAGILNSLADYVEIDKSIAKELNLQDIIEDQAFNNLDYASSHNKIKKVSSSDFIQNPSTCTRKLRNKRSIDKLNGQQNIIKPYSKRPRASLQLNNLKRNNKVGKAKVALFKSLKSSKNYLDKEQVPYNLDFQIDQNSALENLAQTLKTSKHKNFNQEQRKSPKK
ncbi:hypothetical protein ABSA28_00714 [Candidatus Hepatincolaceae symbiont of Richtersius coronifer]